MVTPPQLRSNRQPRGITWQEPNVNVYGIAAFSMLIKDDIKATFYMIVIKRYCCLCTVYSMRNNKTAELEIDYTATLLS